jgi:(p)ppGpp synthase/HD superfamily hydrolase
MVARVPSCSTQRRSSWCSWALVPSSRRHWWSKVTALGGASSGSAGGQTITQGLSASPEDLAGTCHAYYGDVVLASCHDGKNMQEHGKSMARAWQEDSRQNIATTWHCY